jgi:hypothetical protein
MTGFDFEVMMGGPIRPIHPVLFFSSRRAGFADEKSF